MDLDFDFYKLMQILKCAQYFSCFKKINTEVSHREGKYCIYSKTQFMAGVGLNWKMSIEKALLFMFYLSPWAKILQQNRTEVSRTQMIKTCKRGVM